MTKTRAAILTLIFTAIMSMVWSIPANATDWDDCDHPRFLEHGCGYEGTDGTDGTDGVDGQDGRDGIDGIDGIGIAGKDGRDGVVSETWINETRNHFEKVEHYVAAMNSIQINLPQDASSRLTLAGSTFRGATGIGLGYAYKMDREDNLAFTVGIGTSGGEQVGTASVGLEFGAKRMRHDSYDDTRLEQRLYDLENRFETEKRGWNKEVQACAAEMDEATEIYTRVEERFMECITGK
jgi:hypothetical protein